MVFFVFSWFSKVCLKKKFPYESTMPDEKAKPLIRPARGPAGRPAGGLNMIGIIWLKRKS